MLNTLTVKTLKFNAIMLSIILLVTGCASTHNAEQRPNSSEQTTDSTSHKGMLIGGVGGASLGVAAGVGIASLAFGPLALVIAPIAVIGAGIAGGLAGGATGATVGHHIDK